MISRLKIKAVCRPLLVLVDFIWRRLVYTLHWGVFRRIGLTLGD